MQGSNNVRRSVRNRNRRTLTGRRAAAALIAASAGLAMFSAVHSAPAATFTFTTANADMLDPTAWTPNTTPPTEIPGSTDGAIIPNDLSTTNVPFTLNAGTISLGGLQYDTSTQRTLSNATTGLINSTITFAGLGTTPAVPLLAITRSSSTLGTALTIQGANSSTGSGTLGVVLAASGDIQLIGSSQLTVSADISETGGPQTINKTGNGTLLLQGNNSFSALNLKQWYAQLDFSKNTSPKISSTGSITMSGGTLAITGNAASDVTQTLAKMDVAAGTSSLVVDATGTKNLTLALGSLTRSGIGSVLTFTLTNGSGSTAKVTAPTSANGPSGILGGWATIGSGTQWVAVDSSGNVGTIAGSGYTTQNNVASWGFSGATPVTTQNITVGATFTGSTAASTNVTIGSLRYNSNGTGDTVTIGSGGTLTISSGGVMVTSNSGATHSITGGSITSGNGQDLIMLVGQNKSMTLSSDIVDNGATAIGLTKSGNGTLNLNGAMGFSGRVTINSGSLIVDQAGALGSGATDPTIIIGNEGNTGGDGGTLGFLNDTTLNRPIVLNAFGNGGAGSTIRVAQNKTLTIGANEISGPAVFHKFDQGTIAIQGAQTYTGVVDNGRGTMVVDTIANGGTASGFGAGTGTINIANSNAATIIFNGSGQTNRPFGFGSGAAGLGTLVTNNTFTVTLTGGINLNATSTTPLPLVIDGPGNLLENGSISSAAGAGGTVTKIGTGVFTLGGSNTYAGATTINAGTLVANNGDALDSSSGVTIGASGNLATGLNLTKAVKVNTLSSSGTIDLQNSALIIASGGTASDIRTKIIAGRNGGSWTGGPASILSSTAATVAASTSTHKTAIGYAQGSTDLGVSTFQGQPIDANSIVAAYVLQGDANLDGVVNALDFNSLATNYGSSGPSWVQGDFDYNNTVNSADFDALALNFGMTTPTSAAIPDAASPNALGSLVPEPTSIALLGLFGGLAAARRRR